MDIYFTFSSQDAYHPVKDEIHPGAQITAKKKKKKSPSQKKHDSERRKLFLLKKSDTTDSTKISEENNTSEKVDNQEEYLQCEICDVKTKYKVSLGKHMQKEHSAIPQFDELEDSEDKVLDPCPLCKNAREVPDLRKVGLSRSWI